jgi:hypothetical protein
MHCAMKTYEGANVWIHVFFTSALVGGEWSTAQPGRFTPLYPLVRRLGGPQNRSGLRREDTNSDLSVIQPVAIRYANCATEALTKSIVRVWNRERVADGYSYFVREWRTIWLRYWRVERMGERTTRWALDTNWKMPKGRPNEKPSGYKEIMERKDLNKGKLNVGSYGGRERRESM